jgi:amidase
VAPFNRLTTTASKLQGLFTRGELSSSDAVQAYLEQIDIQNGWLKAVIAQPPRDRMLERARMLDGEHQRGKIRSPLHGIPVLIKDNIDTPSLEVATTSGCYSLLSTKARQDAELVQRLLKAGVIIVAKGGQNQSPYVRGGQIDDGSFTINSVCLLRP